MKKGSKQSAASLFLSVFLVLAYVGCMYFFEMVSKTMLTGSAQIALKVLMYVGFGLVLFYATRIGDGKQVKRFSLLVFLFLDLPGAYIVAASFLTGLPLGGEINASEALQILGYIMLGYGLPYTFLSGFEVLSQEKAEEGAVSYTVQQEPVAFAEPAVELVPVPVAAQAEPVEEVKTAPVPEVQAGPVVAAAAAFESVEALAEPVQAVSEEIKAEAPAEIAAEEPAAVEEVPAAETEDAVEATAAEETAEKVEAVAGQTTNL